MAAIGRTLRRGPSSRRPFMGHIPYGSNLPILNLALNGSESASQVGTLLFDNSPTISGQDVPSTIGIITNFRSRLIATGLVQAVSVAAGDLAPGVEFTFTSPNDVTISTNFMAPGIGPTITKQDVPSVIGFFGLTNYPTVSGQDVPSATGSIFSTEDVQILLNGQDVTALAGTIVASSVVGGGGGVSGPHVNDQYPNATVSVGSSVSIPPSVTDLYP